MDYSKIVNTFIFIIDNIYNDRYYPDINKDRKRIFKLVDKLYNEILGNCELINNFNIYNKMIKYIDKMRHYIYHNDDYYIFSKQLNKFKWCLDRIKKENGNMKNYETINKIYTEIYDIIYTV